MIPSDFHVYLNNIDSIEKYSDNNVSRFKNDMNPPIYFEDPSKWEVAIISCLLQFDGYKSKNNYFSLNNDYDIKWIINDGLVIKEHNVSINFNQLVDLSPDDIVQIFNKQSDIAIETSNVFSSQFMSIVNDKFILKGYRLIVAYDHGIFKNLLSVRVIFNENLQHLFGLARREYLVYSININRSRIDRDVIFGSRKISFGITPPEFIVIYSDIIEPVRYASKNLQILDILPLGKNQDIIERKLHEHVYVSVKTREINTISILIHDSSYQLLRNYSEQVNICLHFRPKRKYMNFLN